MGQRAAGGDAEAPEPATPPASKEPVAAGVVAPPPQPASRAQRRVRAGSGGPSLRSASRERFEELFRRVANADGVITMHELHASIGAVDPARCAGVMANADGDGDGHIDLQDWTAFINAGLGARGLTIDTAPPDSVAHFAAMFNVADFPPSPSKGMKKKKSKKRAGAPSVQLEGAEEESAAPSTPATPALAPPAAADAAQRAAGATPVVRKKVVRKVRKRAGSVQADNGDAGAEP